MKTPINALPLVLGFDRDTFISAMEFISDNPETIHHLTLFLDTNNIQEDYKTWDCESDLDINSLFMVDNFARGMRAMSLPSDLAYKVPKHSRFILQSHYADSYLGKKESTQIGIHFSKSRKKLVHWDHESNLDIDIKANTIKVENISRYVDTAITLLGIGPHMHYLGKVIEIFAVTEDCQKINLLKIPNWDYHWQGRYFFKEPIRIPKGSYLHMNAVYDNSKSNKVNPNQPIRDVKHDISSKDEMMVMIMTYVYTDENYPILKSGYLLE